MKSLTIILFLIIIPLNSFDQTQPESDKEENAMKPSKNENGEWDLTVIDTQFDYFMSAIARPISQYSETYLKSRNTFLVSEWNSYYFSGRYCNIIESSIDYGPREKYGIKFEYKLYQVFAFVNWKYKLRLNGMSASDYIN